MHSAQSPCSEENVYAQLLGPHPERVRVLELNPVSIHIEHQMHLHPGTACTLQVPTDVRSCQRRGRVVACQSLLGSRPPFWYKSEIAFSDAES